MKKVIALSLFFAFSVATYAQQEVPTAKKAVKKEIAKANKETAKASEKINKEVAKTTEKVKKEEHKAKKASSEKIDMVKSDMKK